MSPVTATGRIFGLGLNKTGTTTLGRALKLLDIATIDYPTDARTLEQLEAGDYRLDILENYCAVTDIPVGYFYPHLDSTYPGSKYILTVREKESWLRSAAEHWPRVMRWREYEEDFRRFTYYAVVAVYGTFSFNEERYSFVYDQYVGSVLKFFENRPHDLLVMDICAGEGWEKLCPFLGLPVPVVPFPHVNAKEDQEGRRKWVDLLEASICELGEVWDHTSPLVLVDEGKLANSPLTAEDNVIPFTAGWGRSKVRPTDSAEALAELRRLQAEGAGYIAFAWPAFWWLDHYSQFADHLHNCAMQILDTKSLKVFRLLGPPGG